MKHIAIIGGGASGLMAACFAAAQGTRVTVYEKQKKTGRKLLATGNGRCNITNSLIDPARYHGHNPRFVQNIFSRFGLDDTITFFESIGIPLIEESAGKMFPASLQASSVQQILEYEAVKRGVDIQLHRKIDRIIPGKKGIRLITAGREEHTADAAVLAMGSCASPQLGAAKDVYDIPRALGHTIHEPFPAIVPLNIPLRALHRLEGIKWDCRIEARIGGSAAAKSEGELLFTKYGISGPAALDISRAANDAASSRQQCEICIDLFPGRSEEELRELLQSLFSDGTKTLAFSLRGILKERMPEVLGTIAGIDPYRKTATISKGEIRDLAAVMKHLTLDTGEPRSFNDAVVAAGGVEVSEINPATMESRIAKGLYITGELLDIDGDTGGFNLQFAWSTGAIAGIALSLQTKKG